jgi:hypothetical protein
MKKSLLFYSFIFSFLTSFTQHLMPIQYDTLVHNYEVITTGIADFGATGIERQFSSKLLFGGEITNEIKDASFDKHKGLNRIGADVQAEVEFRNYKSNLFKQENIGWLIKGGYYNFGSALYTSDMFGLGFYGNQRYLGESIDLTGSSFGAWSYQKIGFGIIDKKTKSNLSLNFYSISGFGGSKINQGSIFQTSEADSLSIRYDGYAEYSSSSKFMKGWGIGIDFDVRLPVQIKPEETSYIQILVKNVGVAFLPDVKRYEADSSFTYEGLSFSQLFGDAAIIGDSFSLLDTLNVKEVTYNKIALLPGFLQIGKIVDNQSAKKVQSFFGVRMYPSLSLIPMIYAGANYKPIKCLHVGANVSYGGYSKLRFGLYTSFNYKQFDIGLATEEVVGAVSGRGMGESVVFRLRWKV